MLLRRKGVNNPGPEEQVAYILQNQLATGESSRWISLACADEKISDATLHELELRRPSPAPPPGAEPVRGRRRSGGRTARALAGPPRSSRARAP
jgi:hypothetical protein